MIQYDFKHTTMFEQYMAGFEFKNGHQERHVFRKRLHA